MLLPRRKQLSDRNNDRVKVNMKQVFFNSSQLPEVHEVDTPSWGDKDVLIAVRGVTNKYWN